MDSSLDNLNDDDLAGAIDLLDQFAEDVSQAIPNNISEVLGDELITMATHIIEQLGNIDGSGQELTIPDLLPFDFYLSQAYPNPFNSMTRLSYGLPEASHVSIVIYNISGRLVTHLVDAELEASHQVAVWDAGSVPNGVYLVRMKAANFNVVREVVLMR